MLPIYHSRRTKEKDQFIFENGTIDLT